MPASSPGHHYLISDRAYFQHEVHSSGMARPVAPPPTSIRIALASPNFLLHRITAVLWGRGALHMHLLGPVGAGCRWLGMLGRNRWAAQQGNPRWNRAYVRRDFSSGPALLVLLLLGFRL